MMAPEDLRPFHADLSRAIITVVNATIADIMHSPVMTLTPHQKVGHARDLMDERGVSALPLVTPEGELVGIVTASDLVTKDHSDDTPVGSFAKRSVYTVHPDDGPHVAARIMRNHRLHHVVVVDHHHEAATGGANGRHASVTGIVSSYDLLSLVEEHRFVAKNAPTPSRKRAARR